jgi:hypothetical protein
MEPSMNVNGESRSGGTKAMGETPEELRRKINDLRTG